jgi:putative transposase
MARIARVVIPGLPHHVVQRGNRGQKVFLAKADYERYLDMLVQFAPDRGLKVLGYCLMPDHLHLVVVPRTEEALAGVLKRVNLRHSQQVNRRLGVTGLLWQGRFLSCAVEGDFLWAVLRYVERNPVRAGLVRRAETYEWSSAAAHCGRRCDGLLAELPPRPRGLKDWSAWLRQKEDEALIERLRMLTRTGRPLGNEDFILRLERRMGQRLRPLPVGRPPKNTPLPGHK